MCSLWAGDTAVFVDFGFSPDGRTYMFGQHGVEMRTLHPWADLYIVDVGTNRFVQNGRHNLRESTPIRAGQDGSGVLQKLVSNNSSLISRHNINFRNQGLPLYISLDMTPDPRRDEISFRNFHTGITYKAVLVPTITGSRQNVSSRFHINLEARNTRTNQIIKTYTVGTPNFNRAGIEQYNIKRVIIDPNNTSIIFVIEMRRVAENGHDIRYMVEAVRL